MSNKIVKKFFNLVENSREFYKDFLGKEPKNIYIPEIFLSIKEFIYINEKCNEFSGINLSQEMTPTEYSFIYYIGINESINVTSLSKITKSSKGYASKVIKKLEEMNYIKTSRNGLNKKEVFLSLSKNGVKIYMDIYRHLFNERNEFQSFLEENFIDEELKNIFNFFTKMNKFKNEKYIEMKNIKNQKK